MVNSLQFRTIHVHDVLTTFWRGSNQQQFTCKRRPVKRYLLRHHAAERETQHIHACEAESIREGDRVSRHTLNGLGDLAGEPSSFSAL